MRCRPYLVPDTSRPAVGGAVRQVRSKARFGAARQGHMRRLSVWRAIFQLRTGADYSRGTRSGTLDAVSCATRSSCAIASCPFNYAISNRRSGLNSSRWRSRWRRPHPQRPEPFGTKQAFGG